MKLFISLALAALLAASLFMLVKQQNALTRLRSEQQTLAGELKSARTTAAPTGVTGIEQLRRENEEAAKLKLETRDLPKLRNEARQLRQSAGELEQARADNRRLQAQLNGPANTSAVPEGFITRAAMHDAGFLTPEATVQTFFHAVSTGDVQRAMQCANLPPDKMPPPEAMETQRAEMTKAFNGFPGFRITETKLLAPDKAQVSLQTSVNGAPLQLPLVLVGGEWKFAPDGGGLGGF